MVPHHHLYGLAWAAAALVWVLCGTLALARRGCGRIARARAVGLLATAATTAVLGARLHFLLLSPDLLRDGVLAALFPPLDEGAGLRITGGLLAAGSILLALGPRVLQSALGRAELCDALVPLAGVAIAIGRLGCLADGCCFGVPCAAPWCVRFPAASPAYWSHVAQGLIRDGAPASLPVHPLQLYLAASGLIACAASRLVATAKVRPGSAALLFVAVLSLLRTVVEPLREASFGGGVAYEQRLGLACAAAALLALILRAQRRAAGAAAGS